MSLDFSGRYLLAAPRAEVWRALNDTAVLQKTIPGCEHIAFRSDNELDITIAVGLGPTRIRFAGTLTLSNIVPAQSYTLSGRGKGGLLGHAHGSADITLTDHAQGTVLAFGARGGASTALMKFGRGLLGKSAQSIIDRFFERFAEAMRTTITPLGPDG